MTKEQFRSADKLLFFQAHNIVPMFQSFIIGVLITFFTFMLFTEQSKTNKAVNDTLNKQHQAITEDRAAITNLMNRVKELEATPTPTQALRRSNPTPTPKGN